MENRTQIIGDELFGEQGEAAQRCVELLLCLRPNRPMQFSVNAPVYPTLNGLLSRASADIIGKRAGRIVFGLGLAEMKREGGNVTKVVDSYRDLLTEILKKTQAELYLLTVPADLLPEIPDQVAVLNDSIRGFVQMDTDRVKIMDFAIHVEKFKEMQLERGKYARSLYSEEAKPTSLCITLLSLFMQKFLLESVK